jgi:hypothetical protein
MPQGRGKEVPIGEDDEQVDAGVMDETHHFSLHRNQIVGVFSYGGVFPISLHGIDMRVLEQRPELRILEAHIFFGNRRKASGLNSHAGMQGEH